MNNRFLMTGFLCLLLSVATQGETIDFSKLDESGLISRTLKNSSPEDGCLKSYDLSFPEFKRGVMNEGSLTDWIAGYLTGPATFTSFAQFKNRSYETIKESRFRHAFKNGYSLLLELTDGRYLSILPVVSDDVMGFISVYEGTPQLKLATFGTEPFSGEAPLFSWAFADDPYSATQKCWEQALLSDFCRDNIQWRSQKNYPELYEYLGWCTWEAFEGSITEKNVVQSIEEIKESPVPVRWVIVDDGYLDGKAADYTRAQLFSFGTNNKFPNGWDPITSLKDEDSVKWIGIWRNMSGHMYGVHPEHTMTELRDHLTLKTISNTRQPDHETEWIDTMVIKPGMEHSQAFYDRMTQNTAASGFDFQKVDFQTYNFWMYNGTANAVRKAHENNQALEASCFRNKIELLNCISQCNVNVFNTRHSVISRSSVDIKLDNDNMSRTIQSFANNMWWGDILVGDFDMYHTGNEKTAQYLTVARAVSGGPVYISDKPTHFESSVIKPLIFNDGKLVRALAPAVPLPDTLFSKGTDQCYRVIAPTRHKSCAIAAFNFSDKPELEGLISKADYPFAAAKEQPYTGLWPMPKEGLVVYDHAAGAGARLTRDYTYRVERMKGKIFNLAPVKLGWAVIGRADKYLGGCTYKIENWTAQGLDLTLDESGPIVVYHSTGKIVVSEGRVNQLGNGLYRIDLPVGERDKTIHLAVQ